MALHILRSDGTDSTFAFAELHLYYLYTFLDTIHRLVRILVTRHEVGPHGSMTSLFCYACILVRSRHCLFPAIGRAPGTPNGELKRYELTTTSKNCDTELERYNGISFNCHCLYQIEKMSDKSRWRSLSPTNCTAITSADLAFCRKERSCGSVV